MSKLDDLFDKKKDEAPMLDLSKTVINTTEEYRAVLDKVPEFKTRPEKVFISLNIINILYPRQILIITKNFIILSSVLKSR